MKIKQIYRDESIVVVEKPADVLTVPDRHDADIPSLSHALGRQLKQPVLTVHRLDRPTSGLLVFALNTDAQRELSRQFEQREVEKIYQAVVDGRPREPAGTIDQPLAPHPSQLGKMMVSAKGKPSTTNYRVVDFFGEFSLLEVELLTGRTHQIRVHLAYIGHPLMVDPDYGKRKAFFLSSIKGRKFNLKRGEQERALLRRVPLHAGTLSFKHPLSGEAKSFSVDPPKDIRATINQLKKWG